MCTISWPGAQVLELVHPADACFSQHFIYLYRNELIKIVPVAWILLHMNPAQNKSFFSNTGDVDWKGPNHKVLIASRLLQGNIFKI